MTGFDPRPFLSRRALAPAVLCIAALAAMLPAGPAAAAPGEGRVTIAVGKQRAELPVVGVKLLEAATVRTRGVLKLPVRGKTVALRRVLVQIAGRRAALSAKLGKRRLVLLRARGPVQLDAGSVELRAAKLWLTRRAARLLRRKLGMPGLRPGRFGRIAVRAALAPAAPVVVPPAQAAASVSPPQPDPEPEPEPEPEPNPYPYEAECSVPAVEGGPDIGDAPGEAGEIAAAPVLNPGTAQPVAGTQVEWGFKQTFRNYVLNVPTAGTLQPLDGAGASAAGPAMAAPGQFFDFPVAGGTYEPGTEPDHSDDRLVAEGGGTVLFCKPGHGFNVVLRNPAVTIDGAESRIAVDIAVNLHGEWYPFQRVDFAELDLSSIDPQISDGGNTIAWEEVPAELTADGAAATGLADQYPAGTPLDPVSVETALERPLLAECGVDSGTATPPAVDFTLAALPTLTDPVVREGKDLGTINWGFRRATRGTVGAPGGLYLPLGGATEAFPGSMGGGNALPPSGGIGKFFRFPISSYEYEEGTADPGDDRLIATSDATVGLCKPQTTSGNYGVVISKPTLIVDGANSRIVANAYSFLGPFAASPAGGWVGGRVDLVNLDTSTIDTTTGVGTVRWGEVNPDWEPLQNGIPVSGGLQTEALSLANLTEAGTAGGGFDPVAAQIVLPPA